MSSAGTATSATRVADTEEYVASRMLSCPARVRASWPAHLATTTMDRCGLHEVLVCDDREIPLGWMERGAGNTVGATVGEAISEPLAWVAPDVSLADARTALAAAGVSRVLVRPHADGPVLGFVTAVELTAHG